MRKQLHPEAFRRGQGLTGRVAETGEPIIFENVKTDPRYQELSQTKATQKLDYCFFAIFPIKSKERFLGTINCLGKEPRKLIAEEVRLINSMCDQIGVAVDNINLFEQVRSKTAELESSNSELREALEQQTATSRDSPRHRQLADRYSACTGHDGRKCRALCDASRCGNLAALMAGMLRPAASYGTLPVPRIGLDPSTREIVARSRDDRPRDGSCSRHLRRRGPEEFSSQRRRLSLGDSRTASDSAAAS